jgi:hypothetical protein
MAEGLSMRIYDSAGVRLLNAFCEATTIESQVELLSLAQANLHVHIGDRNSGHNAHLIAYGQFSDGKALLDPAGLCLRYWGSRESAPDSPTLSLVGRHQSHRSVSFARPSTA